MQFDDSSNLGGGDALSKYLIVKDKVQAYQKDLEKWDTYVSKSPVITKWIRPHGQYYYLCTLIFCRIKSNFYILELCEKKLSQLVAFFLRITISTATFRRLYWYFPLSKDL